MTTTHDHVPTERTTRTLTPETTDVRFTTTHLLGLGRVAGSVRLLSGSVTLDGAGHDLVALEAELDLTSFDSGSRARDRAVASARVLDTARHPRATYRSTGVDRVGAGWRVHGGLTARGVTAPVELHVTGSDPASGGEVTATATVDRTPYLVALPTALAGRVLEIRIAVRPSST